MSDTQQLLQTAVENAFANQRELNHRLRPDWVDQGWQYFRAVAREAMEISDHTNWEWWKKGSYGQDISEAQMGQIQVELVDLLHFGLSLDIVRHVQGGPSTLERAKEYVEAFSDTFTPPFDDAVDSIIIDALLLREFNVKKFAAACREAKLPLKGLLAMYYGKTALNMFRWDNGYNLPKDDPAVYVKMWSIGGAAPAEDNVYLVEAIRKECAALGSGLPDALASGEYTKAVYARMAELYATIAR